MVPASVWPAWLERVMETPGLIAVITAPAGIPVPLTDWPTRKPAVAAVAMMLEPAVVLPVTVAAFAVLRP